MKRIKFARLPTCTGWRYHVFHMGSKLCLRCKGVAR